MNLAIWFSLMHKKKPNLLLEFWVLFIASSSMKRLRFSTLKKMELFYKRGKMHFFIKRCFNKYYRDNIKYYHRRRDASFLVFLCSLFYNSQFNYKKAKIYWWIRNYFKVIFYTEINVKKSCFVVFFQVKKSTIQKLTFQVKISVFRTFFFFK